MESSFTVPIIVWEKGVSRTVQAERGISLKQAINDSGASPFSRYHCGGMGICGTCKVKVKENGEWWERRSCQLRCFHTMEIEVE